MRDLLIQIVIFLLGFSVLSQEGFRFPEGVRKDKIKFELVNNLVVVPVTVNGTELSFLLDTGVRPSIIFSLEETDSLLLNYAEPIQLRGLGGGAPIEALKSKQNVVQVGKASDSSHNLYVIFGSTLNLSPRMGIPIHGILGFEFFKNFVVKTNYAGQRLTIFDPERRNIRKCGSCTELDLTFFSGKPFVEIPVMESEEDTLRMTTLLLDSGSSDAIWLFDDNDFLTTAPPNYFEDFLGLGLSGNIFGKRSRIHQIGIGRYHLNDVNISYPDSVSLKDMIFFEERDGSLGGDILRRFTTWISYKHGTIRLRRNRDFDKPFYYNMSGLTIEHDGLDVYKEERSIRPNRNDNADLQGFNRNLLEDTSFQKELRISLVPRFVIVNVRANSPSEKVGLIEEDEILEINGKPAHKMDLFEINALFSSEQGRKIKLRIRRNNREFEVQFRLKPVL